MTEPEMALRMGAYAIIPDLEPNQKSCLAKLEQERSGVRAGRKSELFATGVSDQDALVMLDELIWFASNHLFSERSSSAS
jgi:hypothetical protein